MRAKRARQEQEKKDRDRERKTKAARAQAIRDLAIARKHQSDSKIEGLKLMALQDQAEWSKINRTSCLQHTLRLSHQCRQCRRTFPRASILKKKWANTLWLLNDGDRTPARLTCMCRVATLRRERRAAGYAG